MIKYFAFCKEDIVLTSEGTIPSGSVCPFPVQPWNEVTRVKVGEDECVAIRLDKPLMQEGFRMHGLRSTYEILPETDYRLAGKCAELLYFDQNSKFCGCCGAPMKWQDPISKKCQGCGKELWPPLAIATIVRVTRQLPDQPEEMLMVQARNFRTNHYGLVAGFVETGETLEQCVERELWEETHVKVKNIKYFGSQPWPYPCGLMVGFTADYVDGEIQLQKAELTHGGWFTRDNLPPIPGKASIARQLIDDWLKK